VFEAVTYCKEWIPERRWLQSNGVDCSEYEQEVKFVEFNRRYKLIERAKAVRMTRAINDKIEEVGGTELQKEMLEVAKKKHEKKLIRARSQFESFSQASSEAPIVRVATANSRLGSQA